ncbi:MAG: hypothetical protein AABY07_07155 [Nanoarchaeota archaeon]
MLKNKPEIKLDTLSDEVYFSMDLRELITIMEELGVQNRSWMNRNLEKTIVWVLVDKDGEIIEESDRSIIPTYREVREQAKKEDRQLYMFVRSPDEYRDVTYFLDAEYVDSIAMILSRDSDDFFPYLDPIEMIRTINAQSGLTNKLKEKCAVGKLYQLKPLFEPGNEKEGGHNYGSTVVNIDNAWMSGHDQLIHIASQNIHLVHARGSKVSGERSGSKNCTRFERLHRFDDPILDIFDTYRFYSERFEIKPNLVLFGSRKEFDSGLEQRFSLEKYRTF